MSAGKHLTQAQLETWLQQRPQDTDAQWAHWSATALSQFWEQVKQHDLITADEVNVRYATFVHPDSSDKGWVVISPGRIESFLKYQEIILELAVAGYSVAALDHRGQGFSDRTSHHPQHGHITHFDEFVRDFADFMLALKPQIRNAPCQLLAHSMGAAIGCLYMAHYPHPFRSAVLSAPMMGVKTKPWPQALARTIIAIGHWINRQLLGDKPRYFIGMQDYADISFQNNDLTHSAQRYAWFRAMYEQHPQIQLGGPTVQWLKQSIQAMAELPEAAQKIRIPVFILQATDDHIVSAEPQHAFMELSPHPASTLQIVQGSFHEVLMETDDIRGPAMASALDFFAEQAQAALLDKSFSAPPRGIRSKRLAR